MKSILKVVLFVWLGIGTIACSKPDPTEIDLEFFSAEGENSSPNDGKN